MDRRLFLASLAGSAGGLALPAPAAAQGRKPSDVEACVDRGLDYLKRIQNGDGHWEAQGGQYPTSMTGLAGMAMLMEGSTVREGRYSDQIRKAVNWFLAPQRVRENGLIGDPNNPTETQRYMYGQGFGTLFLACCYGEEEDVAQRKRLEAVVTKAIDFIARAQTRKTHRKAEGREVEIGGWGYVSATDNNSFDEGSVTITQLQALRAARNAGIKVPKETIDKALAYLEACTTNDGGIVYNYTGNSANGQGRPPLTAAAICCGFSGGQYRGELPKKWLKNCQRHIWPTVARGRVAHDEYQTYYFAQAMYALGDNRWAELFPDEPAETRLTWSKYKEAMYPYLMEAQNRTDGSWQSGFVGNVFSTAVNLTVLQLEKGILPIYQR
ncbi:prenyltransferase/squalene oxidase repeat-containing protein [Urbifossiella limnaea]|uniref:Prenyltransferase and squalene oxidase repeat protein n=1 Tax=Urbifossiella limnaea TaxID=2528023 RepID=A0A517XPS2_9BACT|nr:prenyltransferase/squalene oxidase repeat-containing protein [Urbifossiella limnaea]QDU19510.1 Prenyltransferase and squalene oxidase repeat protein [Urbifossiella limnaea]